LGTEWGWGGRRWSGVRVARDTKINAEERESRIRPGGEAIKPITDALRDAAQCKKRTKILPVASGEKRGLDKGVRRKNGGKEKRHNKTYRRDLHGQTVKNQGKNGDPEGKSSRASVVKILKTWALQTDGHQ